MTSTKFKVPDMSCGHCKAAVEEELGKLPGVELSNADPVEGTVEVAYDEGRVGEEQLTGAIEEVGYTVAGRS